MFPGQMLLELQTKLLIPIFIWTMYSKVVIWSPLVIIESFKSHCNWHNLYHKMPDENEISNAIPH